MQIRSSLPSPPLAGLLTITAFPLAASFPTIGFPEFDEGPTNTNSGHEENIDSEGGHL